MYASPIVLIFSRPCCSASRSNTLNSSSSIVTSFSGDVVDDSFVNPTMSANSTVTASKRSTITSAPSLRRSAIGAGSTFKSSRSEVAFSSCSSFVRCFTRSSRCSLCCWIVSAIALNAWPSWPTSSRESTLGGVRAEKSFSVNFFTVCESASTDRVSSVPTPIATSSASAITPSAIFNASSPA